MFYIILPFWIRLVNIYLILRFKGQSNDYYNTYYYSYPTYGDYDTYYYQTYGDYDTYYYQTYGDYDTYYYQTYGDYYDYGGGKLRDILIFLTVYILIKQ